MENLLRLKSNRDAQRIVLSLCADDCCYWANNFAWTYDPREPDPLLPLDLFPRQEELIEWVAERELSQEDGLVEKSRDMGVTWLCGAYAAHGLLFRDGFAAGFGSRKLDLVDKLDDPDCIFEKIRFLINNLPAWMLPRSYDLSYCKLVNHDRGSSITGEGGDEIGRGGRKSIYFVDESAFLERPQLVNRALSQTTRCRIDVSTPNGMGNPFYTRRFSGTVKVFTFHWKDDPRKGQEWYEKEKIRLADPVTVAQELDIDYTASVEGICIPAAWVQSAIEFDQVVKLPRDGKIHAALDIAAEGDNLSVEGFRDGPVVVEPILSWGGQLTTYSAHKALEEAEQRQAVRLTYDSGGGYAGTLESIERDQQSEQKPSKVKLHGINGGDLPSDLVWPDEKSSKQKFVNARAENAWILRERFRKTHEYRLWLDGDEQGAKHPLDDLISIPRHSELIAQLSVPLIEMTNEKRRQLESKKKMRARGVKSPDFFDMLCLLFAPANEFEVIIA